MTSIAGYFAAQADACENLGSPFTARILRCALGALPTNSALAKNIHGWSGDPSPNADSLPLRVASAPHALVLTQKSSDLVATYLPYGCTDAVLARTVHTAMSQHDDFLTNWITRPPQTNEVRRAAGLIAAASWVQHKTQTPLMLSELGASAGLNTQFDRYCLDIGSMYGDPASPVVLSPTWTGPHPPHAKLDIRDAAGCDVTPLELRNATDVLRLKSYIWPDQPDRHARTAAAIDLTPPKPSATPAPDWIGQRLAHHTAGACHLVFSTIAWQYFPKSQQSQITNAIKTAGEASSRAGPIAWLKIEADQQAHGAAITLDLWPNNERWSLGRMDFHGRWINWSPEQMDMQK